MRSEINIHDNTRNQWEKIGLRRRAGVAVPLFSVWSKGSIGVGEISDIRHLIKWCKQTGLSVIQLLPMNDVGFDYAPYNSLSSFALDPMYLCLKDLKDVNLLPFKEYLRDLKKKFKPGSKNVNYEIKKAKLDFLYEIFGKTYVSGIPKYDRFKKQNAYWLEDYALFKVLKEYNYGKSWEDWEEDYKFYKKEKLYEFRISNQKQFEFYCWVQWQLYEQFTTVKNYAEINNVFLMGDIPFLVSRDSADVWAHNDFFKLNLSSGAPPDMYFASGQRWGMPPYEWKNIEAKDFRYVKSKLEYAQNFYDMFRIDHFVGLVRLWTIDINTPGERGGLDGVFDPSEESQWGDHCKKILNVMLNSSKMLPCAEDLGVVPQVSFDILNEYGIPGTDVQRWVKERNLLYNFILPKDYRSNSVSTVSTHDSSGLIEWWITEAGTIDERLFERLCSEKGIKAEKYFIIKDKLFDSAHKGAGRLLWKESIENSDILIKFMETEPEKIYDIISLYKDSFREKNKFLEYIGINEDVSKYIPEENFIYNSLFRCLDTNSIFSIHQLNDWLCIDQKYLETQLENPTRINFPGIISDKNWSSVIQYPLENFQFFSINNIILELVKSTERS